MPENRSQDANATILASLGQALDQLGLGILLLDRSLRLRAVNQCFLSYWPLPQALLDRRPTFREMMAFGAGQAWYALPPADLPAYLERRAAAVAAGNLAEPEIALRNGLYVACSGAITADGGRLLTYSDISALVTEREALRQAHAAAEQMRATLSSQNADLLSREAYLTGVAEAAAHAAQATETARLRLEQRVAEQRALEAELRRLATTDALTGVHNRAHTLRLGQRELERCRLLHQPLAVLVLDVDHFKAINDRHGHAAGDAALRTLTATVAAHIRRVDRFGRLGGEEFAVILPGATPAAAWQAAERLRARIALTPAVVDGTPIPMTVSIGLAMARATEDTIEAVLLRADRALYAAKAGGRNRLVGDGNAALLRQRPAA